MPTTVYDLFASCITHIPVFLKKDKKIYDEIKEHLKIFGADALIDKSIGDLSGGELQRKSFECFDNLEIVGEDKHQWING